MERNQANQAVANFDVKRFAPAGWLLFAAAVAVGIGAAVLVDINYEQIMDVPPNQRVYTKDYKAHALAVTLSGVATFLAGFGVCRLAGVTVIRPKPEADNKTIEGDENRSDTEK